MNYKQGSLKWCTFSVIKTPSIQMKNIVLILCLVAAGCCGAKKSASEGTGDSAVVKSTQPACINEMIKGFASAEKENPPRKIYSYTYQGKTVYYVTPPCCDFFSDLYDAECKLLGHPDGGITGKGDGKFADFETTKRNEKLVWEDKR